MISVLHSHDGYYYFLSVALSSIRTHTRTRTLHTQRVSFIRLWQRGVLFGGDWCAARGRALRPEREIIPR